VSKIQNQIVTPDSTVVVPDVKIVTADFLIHDDSLSIQDWFSELDALPQKEQRKIDKWLKVIDPNLDALESLFPNRVLWVQVEDAVVAAYDEWQHRVVRLVSQYNLPSAKDKRRGSNSHTDEAGDFDIYTMLIGFSRESVQTCGGKVGEVITEAILNKQKGTRFSAIGPCDRKGFDIEIVEPCRAKTLLSMTGGSGTKNGGGGTTKRGEGEDAKRNARHNKGSVTTMEGQCSGACPVGFSKNIDVVLRGQVFWLWATGGNVHFNDDLRRYDDKIRASFGEMRRKAEAEAYRRITGDEPPKYARHPYRHSDELMSQWDENLARVFLFPRQLKVLALYMGKKPTDLVRCVRR
jgi:hypothetical protein